MPATEVASPAIAAPATCAGPDALVVVDGLSYLYPGGGPLVLRDLDLRVARGEFLTVIGPTGAGKSTFCLCLNGIVPHFFGGEFFGSVLVGGEDTMRRPTHALARRVGMVFEDPAMQLVAPTARAEVAFALENVGLPPPEIAARVGEALAAVGLEGIEERHPARLSGGQQQRLAIAAALALRPDLLVLDEPTSQLDPVGVGDVFELLVRLNRERGITVVLVSHAVEEVAAHADRVVILADGRLVGQGTPRGIFQDAKALQAHGLRCPEVTEVFGRVLGPSRSPPPVTVDEATARRGEIRVVPARPTPTSTAVAGTPLIEVRDLRHVYPGGKEALRCVSLRIQRGEYVAVLGQNGGGKSTLVRHFLRLLEPTAGSVEVMGRDVREYRVSELAQRIGYVAQNPDHQIFCASVRAEVAFALEHARLPAAEIAARTGAALAEMRLTDLADRHPLSLSKGDRGRVVIAAVLAMRPEILVFDEPTTGQDHAGATAIMDLTAELHRGGRTVILITHHLHLLPGRAQRAVLMGEGEVLLDAPLHEALYATEALGRTSLAPPQAVQLACALGADADHPLTPAEVAACLAPA